MATFMNRTGKTVEYAYGDNFVAPTPNQDITPSTTVISSPRLSTPSSASRLRPMSEHNAENNSFNSSFTKENRTIEDEVHCMSELSCQSQQSQNEYMPAVEFSIVGSGATALGAAIALYEKTASPIHVFLDNFDSNLEHIILLPKTLDVLYSIHPDIYSAVMEHAQVLELGDSNNASSSSSSHMALYGGDTPSYISSSTLESIFKSHIEAAYQEISLHSPGSLLHMHACKSSRNSASNGVNLYFEDGTEYQSKVVVMTNCINPQIQQILTPGNLKESLWVHYFSGSKIPPSLFEATGLWKITHPSKEIEASVLIDKQSNVAAWSIMEPMTDKSFSGSSTTQFRHEYVSELLQNFQDISLSGTESQIIKGLDLLIQQTKGESISIKTFSNVDHNARKWRYFNDQLLLIGDAAHPLSRSLCNGFDSAMEDALQLGYCILDHPESRNTAIKVYETVQRKYLEPLLDGDAALFNVSNMENGEEFKSKANTVHLSSITLPRMFMPHRENYPRGEGKYQSELMEYTEFEAEYM